MHICDKCKNYNKCYPNKETTEQEIVKAAEAGLAGCSDYKELTIKEMFFKAFMAERSDFVW